jgi:predicted lactoylglutathione lyase
MSRKIFVNIAVKDLDNAKAFYSGLGFSCNPQFTDATAASMVISDDIYVMLLTTEKFESFSPHPASDANKSTEVLLCLSCDSKEEVNDMVKRALANGGTVYREPMDYGFMYGHSFKDPDGHAWELAYMDPSAIPS